MLRNRTNTFSIFFISRWYQRLGTFSQQFNGTTIKVNWGNLNLFAFTPCGRFAHGLGRKRGETFFACEITRLILAPDTRTIDVIILAEINDIIDIIIDKNPRKPYTSPPKSLRSPWRAQSRNKFLYAVIIFELTVGLNVDVGSSLAWGKINSKSKLGIRLYF